MTTHTCPMGESVWREGGDWCAGEGSERIGGIRFCPWCGERLPEENRATLVAQEPPAWAHNPADGPVPQDWSAHQRIDYIGVAERLAALVVEAMETPSNDEDLFLERMGLALDLIRESGIGKGVDSPLLLTGLPRIDVSVPPPPVKPPRIPADADWADLHSLDKEWDRLRDALDALMTTSQPTNDYQLLATLAFMVKAYAETSVYHTEERRERLASMLDFIKEHRL